MRKTCQNFLIANYYDGKFCMLITTYLQLLALAMLVLVAEWAGFEPAVGFRLRRFSEPPP